jgi:PIN domain nuclease of toxin-antitoxin system
VRSLLDTGVFITLALFGLESVKSRKARRVLADTGAALELSAVSLTEIAIKNSIGKLNFSMEFAREMAADMKLTLLPYTPQHAYCFARLPRHHDDPFDRMLIATALAENIPILASDQAFQSYEHLRVIWE